jgi:hypothetical protein
VERTRQIETTALPKLRQLAVEGADGDQEE